VALVGREISHGQQQSQIVLLAQWASAGGGKTGISPPWKLGLKGNFLENVKAAVYF